MSTVGAGRRDEEVGLTGWRWAGLSRRRRGLRLRCNGLSTEHREIGLQSACSVLSDGGDRQVNRSRALRVADRRLPGRCEPRVPRRDDADHVNGATAPEGGKCARPREPDNDRIGPAAFRDESCNPRTGRGDCALSNPGGPAI